MSGGEYTGALQERAPRKHKGHNTPNRGERMLHLSPSTPEELAGARAYLAKYAPDLIPVLLEEDGK